MQSKSSPKSLFSIKYKVRSFLTDEINYRESEFKAKVAYLYSTNDHDFRPENQQECVHPDSIH